MLDFGPGSFFLTPAQLADSPSFRHGIPPSTEKVLRLYACEIIQEAGILLRLPQAVAATAQVLLHRFFCKQSFHDFDCRMVAASCFWLAMKLEEESSRGSKKLDDIVSMFQHIASSRGEGVVPLQLHSPEFKKCKEELLKMEIRVLRELGFVCHVEHPHKLLLGYLNCLDAPPELLQESWNLVNDSLRTTLCVSFPSNVVACGVIFAAARRLSIPLPDSPPWWLLFDINLHQILEVCHTLADLYKQPKSYYMDVQKLHSSSASFNSEPSHLSELSDKNHTAKDIAPHVTDVSLVSSSSASEILNACFLNSPGRFLAKSIAHPIQQSQDKLEKQVSGDISSVTEESNDVLSQKLRGSLCRKRRHIDEERYHRSYSRESEQKHRRHRGHISHRDYKSSRGVERCSLRYYDERKYSSRFYCCEHVRG